MTFGSWDVSKIPDQYGKTIIVTGSNSGLGFVCCREFARKGAHVILGCRNKQRGEDAVQELKKIVPEGSFELMLVDMSSLESVRKFSQEFFSKHKCLDVLLNNAGVMMVPEYTQSKDGFEMQMATNHLAAFALTGLLMPALRKSPAPRVVAVSSVAAWSGFKYSGKIDFIKSANNYHPYFIYSESKLANLLFMKELCRRYPDITAVAAHPGIAATNLWRYQNQLMKKLMQSGEDGAMPLIKAATDLNIKSGSYVGCTLGFRGSPMDAWFPPQSWGESYSKEFWEKSIEATNIKY